MLNDANNPKDARHVSAWVKEAIDDYRTGRSKSVGGFLYAVLTNNLSEAAGRADLTNAATLAAIAGYVWNTVPVGRWGTPEKVDAWLAQPRVLDVVETDATAHRASVAAPGGQ